MIVRNYYRLWCDFNMVNYTHSGLVMQWRIPRVSLWYSYQHAHVLRFSSIHELHRQLVIFYGHMVLSLPSGREVHGKSRHMITSIEPRDYDALGIW